MRSLEHCFTGITDPRRSEGRRHRLPVVLGIAAGATLCGMEGYKAMPDWANALGRKARERFGCGRENGLIEGKHYVVDLVSAEGHYDRFPRSSRNCCSVIRR